MCICVGCLRNLSIYTSFAFAHSVVDPSTSGASHPSLRTTRGWCFVILRRSRRIHGSFDFGCFAPFAQDDRRIQDDKCVSTHENLPRVSDRFFGSRLFGKSEVKYSFFRKQTIRKIGNVLQWPLDSSRKERKHWTRATSNPKDIYLE